MYDVLEVGSNCMVGMVEAVPGPVRSGTGSS
jgi:hypothetical protein